MKEENKTFSHIRKKVPFTGRVASMSLDTYYKEHVQQNETKTGKCSKKRGNYNRTHYFGPGYQTGMSPAFQEQTQRLKTLQRNIREVKGMIDFKAQINSQQKMLDQLKIDIDRVEQAVAITEVARETEPPEQQRERGREPLVLMIDDEVIYDEEYQFDPIWRQDP